MVLVNSLYTVTITMASMPSLDEYTVVYKPDALNLSNYYSAILLKIEPNGGPSHFLALVDRVSFCAESCAVLENGVLTVILFRTILRIDLSTGIVIQCVDCDNIGGLEQILPIDHGYIIKGECDIFQYDSALTRVWHFRGRDILHLPQVTHAFGWTMVSSIVAIGKDGIIYWISTEI